MIEKLRPVQIRFRREDFAALEHWATSQSMSLTEAVSLAVRKLVGSEAAPATANPVNARGLLRSTRVMEGMDDDRRSELIKDLA